MFASKLIPPLPKASDPKRPPTEGEECPLRKAGAEAAAGQPKALAKTEGDTSRTVTAEAAEQADQPDRSCVVERSGRWVGHFLLERREGAEEEVRYGFVVDPLTGRIIEV